ncbi:PAS domain-containing protein [Fluviispira vulneris]|uniref:PAS domain-containing protein n=1 Tax=Fluviispira vulneris TaxID=2763012 RepID=UPI0016482832|nr:PAS domain-containing protein [Fluviispira vulneris]
MQNNLLLSNEDARLEELYSFQILDSEADEQIDAITEIAFYITQVPIVLVSLIDKDRQWFKSKIGIHVTETPREISFCAHTIQQKEIFIVENALIDERFKNNPLVKSDPNITFYAGVPLTTSKGFNIGTLCIIDTKTRNLEKQQILILKKLAKQIIVLFEQNKKNLELQTIENRLNLSLSTAKMGVWEWDFIDDVLIWDKSMYQLYEISENDFSGAADAWGKILHPDDLKKSLEHVKNSIENKENIDYEFRVILPSKKIKYIQTKAHLILNSKGDPVKFYGINFDITKEKISKIEADKLRYALNSSAIISATDANGIITFVNDKFSDTSLYSKEELIGKSHKIVNSGYHPKEFFSELWKTIKSGKIWQGEICNRKKNGDIYWVSSYIIPFKNDLNIIDQYISIRYEITEKKSTEKQLIQSAKMSSLGEMSSGIAHEIKNPLAIISGKASLLLAKIKNGNKIDQNDLEKKLEEIQNTCGRIARIIKGLSNFSRDSADDPFMKVKVSNIIENALAISNERLKDKLIEIFVTGDINCEISCRESQITQVLLNLLNNSYDALENITEKWVEIDVKNDLENKKIIISVTDSGNGIDDKIKNNIMQPFFTTKELGKGTGLGLSISKEIVENHGGKFYLDTNNKNTKFILEFPIV